MFEVFSQFLHREGFFVVIILILREPSLPLSLLFMFAGAGDDSRLLHLIIENDIEIVILCGF